MGKYLFLSPLSDTLITTFPHELGLKCFFYNLVKLKSTSKIESLHCFGLKFGGQIPLGRHVTQPPKFKHQCPLGLHLISLRAEIYTSTSAGTTNKRKENSKRRKVIKEKRDEKILQKNKKMRHHGCCAFYLYMCYLPAIFFLFVLG